MGSLFSIINLFINRPYVMITEAYQEKGIEGGIIHVHKDGTFDDTGSLYLNMNILLKNFGHRSTSITKAYIKVPKKKSHVLSESFIGDIDYDNPYKLKGHEIEHHLDAYVTFVGEFSRDFVFNNLKGYLFIEQSHMNGVKVSRIIPLKITTIYGIDNGSISPALAFDSTGRIKDEYLPESSLLESRRK